MSNEFEGKVLSALESLNGRFDGLEIKFDGLETSVSELKGKVNNLDKKVDDNFDRLETLIHDETKEIKQTVNLQGAYLN